MTKYERELREIESGLNYLPRQIRETRTRGRKIRSAEKQVRKAQARMEVCRIACLSLPKPWGAYHPTQTRHGNTYTRQEVSAMHEAIKRLDSKKDFLKMAKERYADKFIDRQAYRLELRALPGKIECLKSLIEIAAKRKKPAKEKNVASKWIEVAPGYFVEKYRIVTYRKTLTQEPIENVSGGFFVLSHDHGYAKFTMKQAQEIRA